MSLTIVRYLRKGSSGPRELGARSNARPVAAGDQRCWLAPHSLLPADPSSADIMWRLVLCGAGFGIFASPNNRLMMNAVPRERSGSAGGIIATARTLGQTVGAALVALVFSLFDFSNGGAADAARAAIWLAAGFAALALVIGSLRLRH